MYVLYFQTMKLTVLENMVYHSCINECTKKGALSLSSYFLFVVCLVFSHLHPWDQQIQGQCRSLLIVGLITVVAQKLPTMKFWADEC